MSNHKHQAELFGSLHVPGQPLVLFNIWDPGSAKAVAAGGALALATGSWSVAAAFGSDDGERLPLDLVIDNLARIVETVDLPVTVDLERGYAQTSEALGPTIIRSMDAGAIGCNLEDSLPTTGVLRSVAQQVERLRVARQAANRQNSAYFINARTDVFFGGLQADDNARVAEIVTRANAYAEAGANGLFVPGVTDAALIARLVAASPLPLNVMVGDGTPALNVLASLGVARVSHGPSPYLTVMKLLEQHARDALNI